MSNTVAVWRKVMALMENRKYKSDLLNKKRYPFASGNSIGLTKRHLINLAARKRIGNWKDAANFWFGSNASNRINDIERNGKTYITRRCLYLLNNKLSHHSETA